jgi:hypothetical protein
MRDADLQAREGVEHALIHQRGHGFLEGLADRIPDLPDGLAPVDGALQMQIDQRIQRLGLLLHQP